MTEKTGELSLGLGAVVPPDFEHGTNCVVGPMSYVARGCAFGSGVEIGAHTTLVTASSSGRLLVRDGAHIAAGVVVSGAAMIGLGSRVEPGAVVTADVPPFAIVAGNPAHVTGYVTRHAAGGDLSNLEHVQIPADIGITPLASGSTIIRFPEVVDLRGRLSFSEVGGLLPFEVMRLFFVYGVPSREIRGEHAHRHLHQVLIAASGSVSVLTDNGSMRQEIVLDTPVIGLHIPPLVWGVQFRHSHDAVLLVLASAPYEAADYIREYDDFLKIVT